MSERTADLSRRHTVKASPAGVVSVTGGKLTTYRKMAQDTVDVVVGLLGRSPRTTRSVTRRLAIQGAPARRPGPARTAPPGKPDHLVARYGTEAPAVAELVVERPELGRPVVAGLPYVAAEVVYAVRAEMARTVADVLDRRTRARLLDGRAAAAAAPAVAELLAAELGWTADRAAAEARGYAEEVLAELERAGVTGAAVPGPAGGAAGVGHP